MRKLKPTQIVNNLLTTDRETPTITNARACYTTNKTQKQGNANIYLNVF